MNDVPVVSTRNWRDEDVKNLEGEVLFKTLANKQTEDVVLKHMLNKPRVARVQIRNSLFGTRFTVTMDVKDKEDLAFLKWVRSILTSKAFKEARYGKKKG